MCPLFAEDVHAHPGIGCHSGDSGYCPLGFAWTLSVSTGALSGGCYLTMLPELVDIFGDQTAHYWISRVGESCQLPC